MILVSNYARLKCNFHRAYVVKLLVQIQCVPDTENKKYVANSK